jgi:phage terminase small subunit
MARGGKREGAGRKPDPNSKRQQALAKKAAAARKPAAKKAPAKAIGRGLTLPNGQKSPDAPPGWPFGTKPPEEPAAPAPDPDSDDGLTDEQRAGLSPLDYLLAVMRSPKSSKSARMTAAIQAAPYVHPKLTPAGKKEAKREAAKGVAGGRFAAAAPPRLAAAGGKRV